MRRIEDSVRQSSFLLDLDARDFPGIFSATLDHLAAQGKLEPAKREPILNALLERERQVSTAIGNAVAVPHAYLEGIPEPTVVFVRLARPVNLGAPDGIPTRFVFVLLGPEKATAEHLDTLTTIARLMSDDEFRYDAGAARGQEDLLAALERFTQRTAGPPAPEPAEEIPPALQYTGRLFGGVIGDLRRRWPHYLDDFRDGLHGKSVASILFLVFACLAPAITFGGIMADYTEGHIGPIEMILASAVCGVIYALFAGQPLIILGGTGPMLVFTWFMYLLCGQLGIGDYFLETLAWVGLWSALFLFILAATDASCLMRYFTRFTDEIFAALISMIFIYAALEKLWEIVDEVYSGESDGHDEALVPLLLAIGTFYIAMSLSRFRRSPLPVAPDS